LEENIGFVMFGLAVLIALLAGLLRIAFLAVFSLPMAVIGYYLSRSQKPSSKSQEGQKSEPANRITKKTAGRAASQSLEERLAPMLVHCKDVESLAENMGVGVGEAKAALAKLSGRISALTGQAKVSAIAAFARREGLSEREMKAFEAMAKGKPSSAIASELSISKPEAISLEANIFQKLGVHNRKEAIELLWRAQEGRDAEKRPGKA